MRIGVVSDVIYPWSKGGAEKRYYEIYTRMGKQHEVHYFTMRYPGMPKHFKFRNMIIHAICDAPSGLYVNDRRKIFPALHFTIALFFNLFRMKFDVLDSNEFPYFPNFVVGFYGSIHSNCLTFSTWHEYWNVGYWIRYLGVLGGVIGYSIQVLSVGRTDGIIAVSNYTRDHLINYTNVREEGVFVVWNGIDQQAIEQIKKVTKKIPNSFVFVGRLIFEKRVDLLILLFRKLSENNADISLRLIGDGPERAKLEERADGLNISFLGFLETHTEVLEEISKSQIFISMSEREGFNIAALEACELDIPTFARLICFDHPNLHELRPDNYDNILKALKHDIKLDIPKDDYSWDNIAEKIETIFRQKSK